MRNATQRLIVVSNRLPFVVTPDGESQWQVHPGSGGLISALVPVLRQRGGTWIGWTGTDAPATRELDQVLADVGAGCGYNLKPVFLTPAEVHDFYQGFSNEVVWPLFHDLQSVCNFDPVYWRTYKSVNRKYAEVVAAQSRSDDFVWVHDYHLMNVGAELRAMGSRARLGFFLHIPFPSLDLFAKLPWCAQLIDALLQYDLIGFQTMRDRRNFVQCVRALVPDVQFEGKGPVVSATLHNRRIRIGAFPISIDVDTIVRQASTSEVTRKAAELHRLLPNRTLVLGIDRLDYTKGIPHRLQAFQDLLHRWPHLRGRISLIQVVVPSRVDIPEYHELKSTIERLVGRINGEFMKPGGWVPVWFVYGHLTPTELLAYYRAADVALVTPLRDGMNLVAKEYCAANLSEDGVLILSEFAGAAAQLRRGALLVNPYDIEGVADAIRVACAMEAPERRVRMRRLRHAIRRHDVFWWVDSFLDAALAPEDAAKAMPQVPMLEMDTEALHAANDAVELPESPSTESAQSRRPHANLLN
ncbi:MAG TPA: trehalose-6-phosphate synthase [Casimicrobiaceae bacterium]|jgi:trehalose 6-phosphate synthase